MNRGGGGKKESAKQLFESLGTNAAGCSLMAAAAEALEGTSELPQIGSPHKKTARIQFDGDSAAAGNGKASDADRMRSKRGSIGVTKLNEGKAKRAAAAHAQKEQVWHFSCLNSRSPRRAL